MHNNNTKISIIKQQIQLLYQIKDKDMIIKNNHNSKEVRNSMNVLRKSVMERKKTKRLNWISEFIGNYPEYNSIYGKNLVRNTFNGGTGNSETAQKLEEFFKTYQF